MKNEETISKKLTTLRQKVAMIQAAKLTSIQARIRLACFESQVHALEWVLNDEEEMER